MTHSLTDQLSGLCLEQTVEILWFQGVAITKNSKFKLSVDCGGLLGHSFTITNKCLFSNTKLKFNELLNS